MTESEIEKDVADRIPQATQQKVKWAMNLLTTWHEEWKTRLDDQLKVFLPVEEWSASDLNHVLRYFLCEIRKADHSFYPPQTLKEIVSMIQHFFNNTLKKSFSIFMDKEFVHARDVLDAQMKKKEPEWGW